MSKREIRDEWKVGICVPSLNAGDRWSDWLTAVSAAAPEGSRLLVIDSQSDDQTAALAAEQGFEIKVIERREFNHGATRQLAVDLLDDCDVIVFLTQDAIPAGKDVIKRLTSAFADDKVGVSYGRQLPHRGAGPVGSHARLFNYPPESYVRSKADIARYGIKTAFVSNSFAAYRREALNGVGGFPADLILGEDMVVAARMLLQGYSVAYCADAQVYHSHDYDYGQEFRRYFDIGVLHRRESWLLDTLGKPEGEGGRFLKSELRYITSHSFWLLPSVLLRTFLKYAGYKMGQREYLLPLGLKKALSMHKGYWS